MPKKIILFADGTWTKPEQKDRDRVSPSNVVKMAREAVRTDRLLAAIRDRGRHYARHRWKGPMAGATKNAQLYTNQPS